MPSTPNAVERFIDKKILFGPGKAANAGGVAVSGLEMAQNSMRYSWTREEVDGRLKMIMKDIYAATVQAAERFDTPGNYVNGANIAGFLKVADHETRPARALRRELAARTRGRRRRRSSERRRG